MSRHHVSPQQRQFAKHLRSNATELENRLWHELRAKRLDGAKFKRQVPIGPYIADFVCFQARLVVEVDGPLHDRPESRLRDIVRNAYMRREGFRILRFSSEVALGRMVEDIRQAVEAPLPTLR